MNRSPLGHGLPCELAPTIPSPITQGYRSKCDFSFGFDLDGHMSVGFLLGLFKEGKNTILVRFIWYTVMAMLFGCVGTKRMSAC